MKNNLPTLIKKSFFKGFLKQNKTLIFVVISIAFSAYFIDKTANKIIDAIERQDTNFVDTTQKNIMDINSNGESTQIERGNEDDIAYIEKYKHLAIEQMERFNIPASIKMAQALLESGAGKSRLARETNNHFGIKCWKKNCGFNMHDDDPDDQFTIYSSVEESYQKHTEFLLKPRYLHLWEHGMDYRSWALGLKASGYATDKKYAEKLISLIDLYELDKLDKL